MKWPSIYWRPLWISSNNFSLSKSHKNLSGHWGREKLPLIHLRGKSHFSTQSNSILLPLQFVAHPNVQQLLASIWYEGLPGFRQMNMIFQLLEVIRISMNFKVSLKRDFIFRFAGSDFCFRSSPWLTFWFRSRDFRKSSGSRSSSSSATRPHTLPFYVSE